MIKKITAGVLAGTLLALHLTGCSPLSVRVQEEVVSSEGAVNYVARLPEQYFISYEVAKENGVVETISKAVDAEGNVYYKDGEEYLFIKDGNNYVLYQWENGEPTEQKDKKYQSGYIDELTEDFDEYVQKSNLNTGGISEYIGEGVVAGRNCNLYSISVKVINFEQKYQFAVDQETYACLEWESEKNISGYEEAGDESFCCVRFDTEQMNLREAFLEN